MEGRRAWRVRSIATRHTTAWLLPVSIGRPVATCVDARTEAHVTRAAARSIRRAAETTRAYRGCPHPDRGPRRAGHVHRARDASRSIVRLGCERYLPGVARSRPRPATVQALFQVRLGLNAFRPCECTNVLRCQRVR